MLDFFVASDVYPATEGNFLKWIIRFLDQYTFPFYELFLICICGLSTTHKYLALYARLGNKKNWIFQSKKLKLVLKELYKFHGHLKCSVAWVMIDKLVSLIA